MVMDFERRGLEIILEAVSRFKVLYDDDDEHREVLVSIEMQKISQLFPSVYVRYFVRPLPLSVTAGTLQQAAIQLRPCS